MADDSGSNPSPVAPILGGAASVLGDVGNFIVSEQNLQREKDTQNYMKEMQQQSWAREDNAVQRRAADMKAAGINPILAAGNPAQASAPINPGTPQRGTINLKSPQDIISMVAAQANIAQTKAQTELINQQAISEANKQDLISAQAQNERDSNAGIGFANMSKQLDVQQSRIDLSMSDAQRATYESLDPKARAVVDMAKALGFDVSSLLNTGVHAPNRSTIFKRQILNSKR